MTPRGWMLLVEDYKRSEQRTELRLWKVTEILSAFMGRSSPLSPEEMFPLLKGIEITDSDDDDGPDPREAFRAIASMTKSRNAPAGHWFEKGKA